MSAAPYLNIHQLEKRFGEFVALQDISLAIKEGSLSAFSGHPVVAKPHCCGPLPVWSRRSRGTLFRRVKTLRTCRLSSVTLALCFSLMRYFESDRQRQHRLWSGEQQTHPAGPYSAGE